MRYTKPVTPLDLLAASLQEHLCEHAGGSELGGRHDSAARIRLARWPLAAEHHRGESSDAAKFARRKLVDRNRIAKTVPPWVSRGAQPSHLRGVVAALVRVGQAGE